MLNFTIICSALLGLLFNMSFADTVMQPDWSLAILLAVLLSNRSTWFWVLPCVGLHDLILYWSIGVTLPYILFVALVLTYADLRLAPGQPQRWFGLVFGCLPLFIIGVDILSCLLTLTLATWAWSLLSSQRERVYVEPA